MKPSTSCKRSSATRPGAPRRSTSVQPATMCVMPHMPCRFVASYGDSARQHDNRLTTPPFEGNTLLRAVVRRFRALTSADDGLAVGRADAQPQQRRRRDASRRAPVLRPDISVRAKTEPPLTHGSSDIALDDVRRCQDLNSLLAVCHDSGADDRASVMIAVGRSWVLLDRIEERHAFNRHLNRSPVPHCCRG